VLRLESVGEEGEVELGIAAHPCAVRPQRHRVILVDRLRVVQQAADEGGLAAVHAAHRGEPQKILPGLLLEELADAVTRSRRDHAQKYRSLSC
jgi:hypothetical protein